MSPPMTSPLPSPLPIDPVFQLVLEVPAHAPRPDLPRRLTALFQELAMDEPPRPVEEIEDQIWALWISHEDRIAEETMAAAVDALSSGSLKKARPLLDHLVELRRRLLRSLAAIAVAFFVCLYFAREIFAVLVQPLLAAGQGRLIFTDVFEAFFVEVKVALFAALVDLPTAAVTVGLAVTGDVWEIRVAHAGGPAVIGPVIHDARPWGTPGRLIVQDDPRPLLPGESRAIRVHWAGGDPAERSLSIDAWNLPAMKIGQAGTDSIERHDEGVA